METYAQSLKFPFDSEFQRRLLALAFREPSFLRNHPRAISPSYFERAELRHLARILLTFIVRHHHVPSLQIANSAVIAYCVENKFDNSLREQLLDELSLLLNMDLADAGWIEEKALAFAQAQSVKSVVLDAAKALTDRYDPKVFPNLVLRLQQAIDVTAPIGKSLIFSEVASSLPELIRQESGLTSIRRIPTGIQKLDQDMFGGIGIGNIGVVMGPTKRGKSQTLVSFGAHAVRNGYNVYHITIQDLMAEEVSVRYAANFTGIGANDVMMGGGDYQASIRRYLNNGWKSPIVKYFPADTLTPAGLRSDISSEIARTGIRPDLLIIDYVDLMSTGYKPTFSPGEYSEATGWLYLQLLKIAEAHQVAVWTASQISGQHWENVEGLPLSSIARSRKKAEHAHFILGLLQTPEDRAYDPEKITLQELAFRFGKDGGSIKCRIDKSTSRLWEDGEEEEDQQALGEGDFFG